VRVGLLDILLNNAGLYEALRAVNHGSLWSMTHGNQRFRAFLFSEWI
jgi:hypothetical protein